MNLIYLGGQSIRALMYAKRDSIEEAKQKSVLNQSRSHRGAFQTLRCISTSRTGSK